MRLGELKPDAILEDHIAAGLGELGTHYVALRDAGRLILLLDGLNEMPAEGRAELVKQLRKLVAACQRDKCAVVVTCRELDYGPELDLGIDQRVAIAPLDPARIRQFINGYIKSPPGAGEAMFWQVAGGEAVREVWQVWERAGASFELFWMAAEVPKNNPAVYQRTTKQQRRVWREAVHGQRSLMRLARNPYMLFMMTHVYAEEGVLPPNRGALFGLFVDFLLLEREKLAEAEAESLKGGLVRLAYRMQVLAETGTSIGRAEVLAILGDERRLYQAQSASLLIGQDEIRFTHQLLQEYFAAHSLDRERKAGRSASAYWYPDRWWKRNVWEETAVLLAGLYSEDCTPVVDWLAEASPEIAARCVLESGTRIPPQILTRFQKKWLPHLTDGQKRLQMEERAALGRALGMLNLDNRRGCGLRPDGC